MSPMSLMAGCYLIRPSGKSKPWPSKRGALYPKVHTTRIDRETMKHIDKTEAALPLCQFVRTEATSHTKA